MNESRVNLTSNPDETKSISAETLFKLDDGFGFAYLLGRSLLAAEYQIKPPDEPIEKDKQALHP